MGEKRAGFLLLWAEIGVYVVMTMAARAVMILLTAIHYEEQAENRIDRVFLAQEVVEKVKYKVVTGSEVVIPTGAVTRNNRLFHINLQIKPEKKEGIPLLHVKVDVSDLLGEKTTMATWIKEKSLLSAVKEN